MTARWGAEEAQPLVLLTGRGLAWHAILVGYITTAVTLLGGVLL